ncbi:AlpA family phage regulatory protein [Mesosutterella sp. OilRF-GAM-744-9]|uniref:AlpA family phage regulatory protein n=1 Tax=Mesosutterella porci TaxID=2915351 RepID=A0ABS9MQK2_9BURK|nr:AlpA family phage regulatory protein [Mesosutterella sp. oilRF-744-WT-GAM-9]MCG5030812.1 AlpA family phage regulatory protein [Mesosutterella sp. oilRF-744-WT-GAM-9]
MQGNKPLKLTVRVKEIAAATGLGRSTIRQYVAEGKFPKPFKVGAATLWLWSDVVRWIDEQAGKSKNAEA